jgi:hypothetical protein
MAGGGNAQRGWGRGEGGAVACGVGVAAVESSDESARYPHAGDQLPKHGEQGSSKPRVQASPEEHSRHSEHACGMSSCSACGAPWEEDVQQGDSRELIFDDFEDLMDLNGSQAVLEGVAAVSTWVAVMVLLYPDMFSDERIHILVGTVKRLNFNDLGPQLFAAYNRYYYGTKAAGIRAHGRVRVCEWV